MEHPGYPPAGRLTAVAAYIAVLLGVTAAWAHGKASWIMSNPATAYCCGPNDCDVIAARDVRHVATGYAFDLDGTPYTVAFAETKSSIDEEFWLCVNGSAPHRTPRCFFAPPMGV